MKAVGFAVLVALCAALAESPGRAQEDAPNAGSDRDGSRASHVGIGDGGDIIGGADKRNNSGGGRGTGQSRRGESDTVHAGSPVHARPDTDANRKGTTAPAGTLGTASGDPAATLSHGVDPVRLEGGFVSLQRRANRKSLIANAPKIPAAPSGNIGAIPQFKRSSTDSGTARNAIGIVVPGGSQGIGHGFPASMTSAGSGMRGAESGVVGVGTAAGNVDGAAARRVAIPLNSVTSPVAQTSGINGTTIGHTASGPSYIGGPTKDRSGINGTTMRPRQ